MFARKLKNNVIEIVNKESQNELLSYTFIPNLSKEDAVALIFAAPNIKSVGDGILTITYQNEDTVNKMFKAIVLAYSKKEGNEVDKALLPQSIHMDINSVPGQSVLIRDPSKQTITIALRKTTNSTQLGINRVFISDQVANAFFKDAKKGQRYREDHKFIIDSRDENLYRNWGTYIDQIYKVLVTKFKALKKAS